MKILITGNMGYVGPSVVMQLRSSYPDSYLVGLDMGYFAHCLTGANILPESRIDLQYFADVRDVPEEALVGVDGVIHLAAISNDPMGNSYEEVTTDINYISSIKLAEKAKYAGVKTFVFASSCSVYGCAEGGPRTEGSELNPLTAYAKSKINTENRLQELAGSNFVVTCLRFATACGMSDRLRLDLVLNDFVAAAIATGKISILSDGTPWRPLIHVNDMARAIDWAVSREDSNGGSFLVINAGSDEWNYQVRDLARSVSEVVGVEFEVNKDAQSDKRSYKVGFGLFRKLAPDYQPQINLKAAIQGLKEGLDAMNFHDETFRDSRYVRLNVLLELRKKGLLSDDLEWHKSIGV